MLKNFIFLVIFSITLKASTYNFILENDALTGTDKHYTNGFFYTWMSEENNELIPDFVDPYDIYQDNLAISLSHLTFTPEDLSNSKVNTYDIPYAGYLSLNLLLYKSTCNYFHEFGISFGFVGPLAHSEEIQKEIHRVTGNADPKGWQNQVDTAYMLNASYQFAYKTDIRDFSFIQYDWTNNARIDIGKFYTGALIGSSFRIGNHLPNNFVTTGNFIGGEESSSLNFTKTQGFAWSLSFGVFANALKSFYITDFHEEYNMGYTDYARGKVLALNFYYERFEFSIKFKSTQLDEKHISRFDEDIENNLNKESIKKWGGLSFRWILE